MTDRASEIKLDSEERKFSAVMSEKKLNTLTAMGGPIVHLSQCMLGVTIEHHGATLCVPD